MIIFTFLTILLIVLLVFIIISSIIKTVIYIATSKNYSLSSLVFPSFLTLLVWCFTIVMWNKSLYNFLDINVISFFIDKMLNINSYNINALHFILITLVALFIGIVLQAISYFSININYQKLFGNIRMKLKSVLKLDKNVKNNSQTLDLKIYENENNLTFANSLLASTIAFAMIFFFIFLLLIIGLFISFKLKTILQI